MLLNESSNLLQLCWTSDRILLEMSKWDKDKCNENRKLDQNAEKCCVAAALNSLDTMQLCSVALDNGKWDKEICNENRPFC